jgi:hypothetical protein
LTGVSGKAPFLSPFGQPEGLSLEIYSALEGAVKEDRLERSIRLTGGGPLW